jgi:hypothetical protein
MWYFVAHRHESRVIGSLSPMLRSKESGPGGRCLLSAILAVAVIGTSCAKSPSYSPWRIDRQQFEHSIKTIALAPITLPEGLHDPDAVRAAFESLIESKLREGGLVIVPPERVGEIWDREMDAVGGLYDPATGQRDEAKYQTVRRNTLSELRETCKADAVMWVFIQVVEAEWSGTTARWDGTTDSVKSRGRQMKESLPFAMMGVSVSYSGSVGALSLIVTVEDCQSTVLYNNRGGIQVIARFLNGDPIPVPASEILTNKERNAASVDIALNPLIGKPPPEVER